jgi:hypothetical protein
MLVLVLLVVLVLEGLWGLVCDLSPGSNRLIARNFLLAAGR